MPWSIRRIPALVRLPLLCSRWYLCELTKALGDDGQLLELAALMEVDDQMGSPLNAETEALFQRIVAARDPGGGLQVAELLAGMGAKYGPGIAHAAAELFGPPAQRMAAAAAPLIGEGAALLTNVVLGARGARDAGLPFHRAAQRARFD